MEAGAQPPFKCSVFPPFKSRSTLLTWTDAGEFKNISDCFTTSKLHKFSLNLRRSEISSASCSHFVNNSLQILNHLYICLKLTSISLKHPWINLKTFLNVPETNFKHSQMLLKCPSISLFPIMWIFRHIKKNPPWNILESPWNQLCECVMQHTSVCTQNESGLRLRQSVH